MEHRKFGHRKRFGSGFESKEDPKKIRIVKVSSGQMPEWVRNEWVGVEIQLAPFNDEYKYQVGTSFGPPQIQNGYEVFFDDAMEGLLGKINKLRDEGDYEKASIVEQAKEKWCQSLWNQEGIRLVFSRDCCELIS